jgi:mercuric ion transport protein
MKDTSRVALPSAGGVLAALGSAVCCGGPTVAVAFGISSAGLSSFEPFRPYLLGATAVFLVSGFVVLDREERASCVPGKPCADPQTRRRMKTILWVGTAIAVLFATFPRWQTLLF